MRRVPWLLCALAFALALLLEPARAADTPAKPPRPTQLAQWVWTQADVRLFQTQGQPEGVTAAPLVATLHYQDARVQWRRGLSPAVVTTRAVVVRLDDSLHAIWDAHDDRTIADALAAPLNTILSEVSATSGAPTEVQLDYDAPVRRLPRWAAVSRQLRNGVLHGKQLWLTSIPAHVRAPRYGDWFRDAADGHILQLFDTGLPCQPQQQRTMVDAVRRHDMPFRIGVGAFERGTLTQHGCWLRRQSAFFDVPGFAGVWVFPAGHPYLHLFQP